MSKIFMYANKLLVKVTGHKYTSTTVKLPFINISFAPAQTTALNGAVFSLCACQSEGRSPLYRWSVAKSCSLRLE